MTEEKYKELEEQEFILQMAYRVVDVAERKLIELLKPLGVCHIDYVSEKDALSVVAESPEDPNAKIPVLPEEDAKKGREWEKILLNEYRTITIASKNLIDTFNLDKIDYNRCYGELMYISKNHSSETVHFVRDMVKKGWDRVEIETWREEPAGPLFSGEEDDPIDWRDDLDEW